MAVIVSITPELGIDVVKNYAGGLGVLEGDKFYAAARLGVPYTVITLFYPEGYVEYIETNGELTPRRERVVVSYYVYQIGEARAVFVKVEKPEWAVKAARRLYFEDTEAERFYKYLILGKAAVNYVDRYVGWDRVKYFDLQEAYTVFSLFFRRHPHARLIIHTPAPWGHPTIHKRFFKEEFGFDMAMEPVVLTEVGLSMAGEGVVVSRKMVKLTCNTFPHHCHKVKAVTNAVEVPRWRHPKLAGVKDVEKLVKIRKEIKEEALRALGINPRGKVVLSWARRVTQYKRPHFVLQLLEELNRDVVFILGGRAHPRDHFGVEMMKRFKEAAESLENVYYFPYLDVSTMRHILWATDIWLFTPFSGWEASGTSFMKAGVNGVPSVASRDGAVVEIVKDGVNGWLFGEDRDRLLPLDSPDIESREYTEFRKKVIEAVEAYYSGKYWDVAYQAYMDFTEYFSMERLFKDYGYL